jgi:hypothetical protein
VYLRVYGLAGGVRANHYGNAPAEKLFVVVRAISKRDSLAHLSCADAVIMCMQVRAPPVDDVDGYCEAVHVVSPGVGLMPRGCRKKGRRDKRPSRAPIQRLRKSGHKRSSRGQTQAYKTPIRHSRM